MQTTPNIGLKKPEGNNVVDIEDLNYNADEIDKQIKDLSDQVKGIDVSWDGISNKPSTFPPSPHRHGADTLDGVIPYTGGGVGGSLQFQGIKALQWNCDQPNISEIFWNASSTNDFGVVHRVNGQDCLVVKTDGVNVQKVLYANNGLHVTGALAIGNMNVEGEINNLKQSVVSGKQEVVNALNDKYGYTTGLTTNHTFVDYAWWIRDIPKSNLGNFDLGSFTTTAGKLTAGGAKLRGEFNGTYYPQDLLPQNHILYTIGNDDSRYMSNQCYYEISNASGCMLWVNGVNTQIVNDGIYRVDKHFFVLYNPTKKIITVASKATAGQGGIYGTFYQYGFIL